MINGPSCTAQPANHVVLHKYVEAQRYGAGFLEVAASAPSGVHGRAFVCVRISPAGGGQTDCISPEDARAYARLLLEAADSADPPRCHECGTHVPHLRHHDPAHPLQDPETPI